MVLLILVGVAEFECLVRGEVARLVVGKAVKLGLSFDAWVGLQYYAGIILILNMCFLNQKVK